MEGKMKPNDVIPGMTLYVPGRMSLSHGSSDIAGGKATVKVVTFEENKHIPDNQWSVAFFEIPKVTYSLVYLLREQETLKERYKDQIAHPDPDEDRPFIEPGDFINGQIYQGPERW